MLKILTDAMFGSATDRAMKARLSKVTKINALESHFQALSDDDLASKTKEFRESLAAGHKLDELLVPAFALVREAARRVLEQRHYDVQLVGGMILHEAAIAEMRTGEGKTLVATLAAYLNALPGKGVHVVTANDYLATRDSQIMGQVHRFLGLTVGLIVPGLTQEQRKEAYAADITYATNSEIGFDYLRDGLLTDRAAMVQRPFNYAIVDEVDSILIDEARTPLVISAPSEDNLELYLAFDKLIPRIPREEIELDEKTRSVNLTDAGIERVEEMMRRLRLLEHGHVYDQHNNTLAHHLNVALQAHVLFQRDKHYIVKDDEILIVDDFTGRSLAGRRFNAGLHQALEAKERVRINAENQTVASVTYQNFFREYAKLSGMTGTAATEAEEFAAIYGLPVDPVPTNRPVIRKDHNDEIYLTHAEKLAAIVKEVSRAHERLQPLLIGTASIEKSEQIAGALEDAGFVRIDHGNPTDDSPDGLGQILSAADAGTPTRRFSILNAHYHHHEALIIAQAGVPGAITIATNMAGRGTDIQLGGNLESQLAHLTDGEDHTEVIERHARLAEMSRQAGGLYVIGTERNESRRIDNQLRGRSGRQGDPGQSKFFLSLTDDVLRIFGSLDKLVAQLDMKPGESVSHPIINGAVTKAQKRFEAHNFQIRKQVVQFDEVINQQRLAVRNERFEIMDAADLREMVDNMRRSWIDYLIDLHVPPRSYPEQWDAQGLEAELLRSVHLKAPVTSWAGADDISVDDLRIRIHEAADDAYASIAAGNGVAHANAVERHFLLLILDFVWREHLEMLDHLKQVVGWRAVGQRDPIAEFRNDATTAFEHAMKRWEELVTYEVTRTQLEAVAA